MEDYNIGILFKFKFRPILGKDYYVSTEKLFKYEWILFSSALNLIL